HENHEVGEPPSAPRGFPTADPFLETHDRFDHDIEIFIFRPTGRTDDEADVAAANAEPRKERLPKSLALGSVDWRERFRGSIVDHRRVRHAEPGLEKRRQAARDAQVRFHTARVAPLVPARQPDGGMPLSEA